MNVKRKDGWMDEGKNSKKEGKKEKISNYI